MSGANTWRRVSVVDVCQSIMDCVNKTAPVVEGPTPYKMIRTTNVRDGWVDVNDLRYVDAATFEKWTRRQIPKRGDVILTREAPLGEVGMLRSDEHVFLGQRLVAYRADSAKLDGHFLLYAMLGEDMQGQIRSMGSGATVEHMRVPDCEKLTLRLPSLKVQRQIGSILSAYDDLIENNTRRIAILEEMARRLYEEWFIRFRFPGNEGLPMVESELGLVPQGWQVTTLGQLAEVNARSVRRGAEPTEIHYVDISSVSTGSIDKKERMLFADAPGRARRVVRDGDVIWACVRPNRKSYSLVLNPEPNLLVSTGFAVLSPVAVPCSFLYQCVTTKDFVSHLVNHAKGATYPAVSASDFENAKVLTPSANLVADFDKLAEPMMRLVAALQLKNTNLRTTRDLLLPKLISGELDVSTLPEPQAETA